MVVHASVGICTHDIYTVRENIDYRQSELCILPDVCVYAGRGDYVSSVLELPVVD